MGGIIVLGLIALLAAVLYKMIHENEAARNHRLIKSDYGTELADAGLEFSKLAAPVNEEKREVFNWGRFTSNESALNEVNQWLSGQRIIVLEMSTTGRLKEFPPNQTIINHLDLKYRESANGSYYQMWYFSKRKWIGHDYSALDEMLENWKASNPDKTVVLKTYNGHQYDGGSTRTLFFLYKINYGY